MFVSLSDEIEAFTPISKWGKSLRPKLKRNIDEVGGMAEAKERHIFDHHIFSYLERNENLTNNRYVFLTLISLCFLLGL